MVHGINRVNEIWMWLYECFATIHKLPKVSERFWCNCYFMRLNQLEIMLTTIWEGQSVLALESSLWCKKQWFYGHQLDLMVSNFTYAITHCTCFLWNWMLTLLLHFLTILQLFSASYSMSGVQPAHYWILWIWSFSIYSLSL